MSTDSQRPRLHYDGSFDLRFLYEGETVESAADGTGACYVTRPTGPGTAQGCRLDVGQVLERLPNGNLIAYDAPAHVRPSGHNHSNQRCTPACPGHGQWTARGGLGRGCTDLCRPARHAFYCGTGEPT